ncbi:MAG: hypothetical protein ACRC8Q_08810 [Aeromonas sp.]
MTPICVPASQVVGEWLADLRNRACLTKEELAARKFHQRQAREAAIFAATGCHHRLCEWDVYESSFTPSRSPSPVRPPRRGGY